MKQALEMLPEPAQRVASDRIAHSAAPAAAATLLQRQPCLSLPPMHAQDPAMQARMKQMQEAMARPEMQQQMAEMQAYMQNAALQQRMQELRNDPE